MILNADSDAQADLSLRMAHMPLCWFCRDVAHIIILIIRVICLRLSNATCDSNFGGKMCVTE